ncbi:hypothetical protein J7E45_16080 [Microbacterium sp. ISL-59]|uniref:hypothetical protein n=1 Tax=Microbacterium sp. ISL-59 TaxID=2819159 RepID=UPI001BE91F4E|nr:hypothetical protein [Microbacterium sp. ISL-59]MBT2497131.1 hypothetical protein [Microbacterium sp. ISL-59]
MTTTLRDRVFDTIPGYHDAKAIIAHTNSASPITIPDAREARGAIFNQVRVALLSGEPVPDSFGEALAELDRAERSRSMMTALVAEVVRAAEQSIENALPIDIDTTYHLLDHELQALVSNVKNVVPDLEGATTASEAVANGGGAVEAWREVQRLAEAYDEIRSVQHEILPRTEGYYWDRLLTVGLYRDALAVHPYFPERSQVNWGPHGRPQLSSENSWWPGDVDRPAALLRIVTHTTPWVPTPSVLEGVWSRAIAASARIGETDDPRVTAERERRLAEHDNYLARL